jgi:hypothetical protein
MTPHEFLKQQAGNVERALTDTLRYDYGPKPTWDYYRECQERLDRIKLAIDATVESDLTEIQTRLDELTTLSVWISLIERSRLGEFSWPFAEALRKMAEILLADAGLSGAITPPIVHIVADGEGYFIHYERTSLSSKRRFAFIAFPRPLKHHVLLHSIFGHELGHSALHTVGAGSNLQKDVLPALQSTGPLASASSMDNWIQSAAAPTEIKKELNDFQLVVGSQHAFDDYYRLKWLDELICDLFGLLLFGPGFAAAHQVYLRPMHSNPYEVGLFEPTHPPYAVRHKMLVRSMQLLHWDQPITNRPPYQAAEQALLDYVLHDPYDPWSTILSDQQLTDAIAGVQKLFSSYGTFGYVIPDIQTLIDLIEQLRGRLPPIIATLSNQGKPRLKSIDIAQTLYAGWIYSIGHHHLTSEPLSFLEINKLCDYALLQQTAINLAKRRK